MKAPEIVEKILVKKYEFQIENPTIERVGMTISTSNATEILKYHAFLLGLKEIPSIKFIEIFAIRVFPSDFISDNEIGIYEIKNI